MDADAGAAEDTELAKAIMARQFRPSLIGPEAWEGYIFSDMEIRIKESTDLYGAVLWPSVRQNLYIIIYYPNIYSQLLYIYYKLVSPLTGNGVMSFLRDQPRQIQPDRQKCDRTGSWNWARHHRIQPVRYENKPVQ